MSLRIFSDFDGVWTDQASEAAAIRRALLLRLEQETGFAAEQIQADVQRWEAHMAAAPEANGWSRGGRITAYVDEDPLLWTSSLAAFLDRTTADSSTEAYRAALQRAGYDGAGDLADRCFLETVDALLSKEPPHMVAQAGRTVARLLEAKAELVVISNSATDKLRKGFASVGVEASEKDLTSVRLRGSARKYVLGGRSDALNLQARDFPLDRPHYREALLAERPGLVIGDVFSLDLALPFALRQSGLLDQDTRLVLRCHPHTPSWARELATEGVVDHLVDHVAEVIPLLQDERSRPRSR